MGYSTRSDELIRQSREDLKKLAALAEEIRTNLIRAIDPDTDGGTGWNAGFVEEVESVARELSDVHSLRRRL